MKNLTFCIFSLFTFIYSAKGAVKFDQNSFEKIPVYTISVLRWSGSQTLWYSTFIKKSDASEFDLVNLRLPAETFENYLWVNREVFLHNRRRSNDFTVTTNGSLQFFNMPPKSVFKKNDEGIITTETNNPPLTEVKLSNSSVNWLLLFFEEDKAEKPLKVLPILDNINTFPLGSVQFFNLSKHNPLFILFGDDVRKVPLGQSAGFVPIVKTGQQITIQLADPAVSTVNPLYSNMWYHENDKRFMILVSEKSRNRTGLDMRVIISR